MGQQSEHVPRDSVKSSLVAQGRSLAWQNACFIPCRLSVHTPTLQVCECSAQHPKSYHPWKVTHRCVQPCWPAQARSRHLLQPALDCKGCSGCMSHNSVTKHGGSFVERPCCCELPAAYQRRGSQLSSDLGLAIISHRQCHQLRF